MLRSGIGMSQISFISESLRKLTVAQPRRLLVAAILPPKGGRKVCLKAGSESRRDFTICTATRQSCLICEQVRRLTVGQL